MINKDKTDIFSVAKYNSNGHWNTSQKGDIILSISALSQVLLGIVQGAFIVLGMDMELSTYYRVILSAIAIVVSVPILLKRKMTLVLITYLITFVIYIIHVLAFPDTIEYWHKEALRFTLPISIPCTLCILAIRDRYVFYYILRIIAYASGFFCLLYGYSVFTGLYDIGFSYNQGIGYSVLFPILVLAYDRKWYSIIFASILFMILLLYGSRGPVMSLALFGAYVLITKRKYGLAILLVLFLIFGVSFLNSSLQSHGLSSRTLELYLSGEIDMENGRDVLKAQIMKGIQDKPTGWGLFGDRVITNGANNAHSLIREVLAEFGVYMGSLVLFLFAFSIIRCFFRIRGADRDMFALFLFAGVAPTLVSGSYLTNTFFAVFVGVMFLLERREKRMHISFSTIQDS